VAEVVRFGVFEANRTTGELRKSGVRIRLQDQPFQILLMLLDHPGEVVTREEIQGRLWPDGTFVEFEHSIGTAIKKLRQALGDDADTPRYIETLPRRGFRFIAPVESPAAEPAPLPPAKPRRVPLPAIILCAVVIGAAAVSIYFLRGRVQAPSQRSLTRLTFDAGLQIGPTWSPDGRYIAFSSDRSRKFDIWVQQAGGTNPVKITTRPGHNWQPDWSPDGSQIAFRSEGEGGGLFVVPALGGLERRISTFGYRPKWSPDGRLILFGNTFIPWLWNNYYVVALDGEAPREILAVFTRQEQIAERTMAWHPDGKRISIWGATAQGPVFWTLSLDGRNAIKSSITPIVASQLKGISYHEGDFRWAPSGRAIYFEGDSQGVQNLARVAVEASTLRWMALERLTIGPGPDTGTAISADGRRLAFSSRSERVRVWSLPFDANAGRLLGKGEAVTQSGVNAWGSDVSPDGRKLAFVVSRAGKWEWWTKSLEDGRETLLTSRKWLSATPRWAPDSRRLLQGEANSEITRCIVAQDDGRGEEMIASGTFVGGCDDWSPDGQWLVASRLSAEHEKGGPEVSMLLLPLSAAPHAETKARVVTSSRTDGLYQSRFSPNGRWIAFEAVKGGVAPGGAASEATLHVVPVSGGPWIPITDGKSWDDKPTWSPDGKTIYFISSRTGFLNVWGIRFDPEAGHPVGKPFQVTSFESPALAVADETGLLQISVSKQRLVLSMKESAGSIWVLDGVDK
jgi:Tol biopolymer transport system component/DNA-binding winged helix-turn-helix (wHTH) protein